jgi:hypothetical protein
MIRKIRMARTATKIVIATAVALVAFGGVYGFAASLGLTTSGLGAGSAVVSSCGSGTTVSYTTTYTAAISGYSVSQVNLASIPAGCLSKTYNIQLTGAGGTTIGSAMSGTLPASGTTATIPTSGNPDASLVTGVSAVFS